VILLFGAFARRFSNGEPSLTTWIVAHRVNPYEPFGTMACNHAKSIAEHVARVAARRATARENVLLEESRQRDAAAHRRERATSQLAAAVKRGDRSAVEALLAHGADPARAAGGASLLELALDNGRDKVAEFLRERGID
jgi:ankyrin repeat protein